MNTTERDKLVEILEFMTVALAGNNLNRDSTIKLQSMVESFKTLDESEDFSDLIEPDMY